jgi:hypothetical protein
LEVGEVGAFRNYCLAGLTVLVCLVASGFGSVRQAHAVDGGAGFYILGGKGSLAGILPPPGLFYTNDIYYYSGDAGGSVELPTVGGDLAVGLDADALVSVNTMLYVAQEPVLGGRFAIGGVLPIVDKHVNAGAELSLGGIPIVSGEVSDSVTAIGDPVAVAALGWDSGNWHATAYNLLNIPVGQYEEGALANAGFNRWAYDFTAAFTYLDADTGFEVSFAPGLTFNGENLDTGYESGTEFHVEYAVMQHFSQQFAIGINGYYYDQLTGDSGSAPNDFKGEVWAIGPAINWNFQVGELPVSLKAKYLHEFDAVNRLEGEAFLFQLAIPLWVPGAEPEVVDVADPL